ncbi:MAG: MATE family efflux transporter [Bacteroidales bacterium]
MKDLTEGSPGRLILRFATPMLIGNVFQQFYNIADSIIVGRFLGKEALAAVGASFPIIFLLVSFVIGITMGSTIIIAQYFGAKDIPNVKRSIDTLYIVLFFTSILVGASGIIFSGTIFNLMNLPADVLPQARIYLSVYLTGSIFFFGYNGISAILRGLGDSKTPLYFLIIATIMNVLLALLFVVVFKWGVAGAAFATVISQGGAFFTGIIYLNRTHPIINLSWRKLHFDREIFNKSLKIGLPSGIQQTFVALGMMALMRVVNNFGTNTLAAYTAAGRIDSLAALPAMNFGAALSTFVGQNLGAHKPERVKEGLKSTFIMASVLAIATTLLVIVFKRSLMGLFTDDPLVIDIGVTYLVIISSFYIFFSSMFVIGGVMRGAGATLIPMFITLFSLWIIRIPLAYILSSKIGVTGIWWAIPIAWFLGAVLSYIYYLQGNWKKKVVVKPALDLPEDI